MSSHDDSTIPMKPAPTPGVVAVVQHGPENSLRRTVFRFTGVLLMLSAVVAISLGIWQSLKSTSKLDDVESIAEMDGFEPISAPADQPPRNEPRRDRLSVPMPDDSAPGSNEMIALPDLPSDMLPRTLSKSAEVWLTGTIENADSPETPQSPLRVSGEPNESAILR